MKYGVIPCLMSWKLSSVLDEIRVYLGSPQSQKVTFGNSCCYDSFLRYSTPLPEVPLMTPDYDKRRVNLEHSNNSKKKQQQQQPHQRRVIAHYSYSCTVVRAM